MADVETLLLVAGFLLLQTLVVLIFINLRQQGADRATGRTEARADPTPEPRMRATAPKRSQIAARRISRPAPASGRDGPSLGSVVLPAELVVVGTVELDGDVILRPTGVAIPERYAEIDVPTDHVDDVLSAFRDVGFKVRETGVTVDTDEGEETLTTIKLDIASLEERPEAGRGRKLLRVRGNLTIEDRAHVKFPIEAGGEIVIGNDVRILGDVRGRRSVRLGSACIVDGEVVSGTDTEVGPGTRIRSIRSGGDVRLSSSPGDVSPNIRARRVRQEVRTDL